MGKDSKSKGAGSKGKSNEEATLAMIAKGKGKDRRGGGKGGGPPSSDEVPKARRDELKMQLETFKNGSESQLAMPTNITGLERKYLHEACEQLGLKSQSFGQGRDRYLCIFKSDTSSGEIVNDASANTNLDGADEPSSIDERPVSYSAVVLDEKSQKSLRSFVSDKTIWSGWRIPGDWKVHCEHMTICVGALKDPKTVDNRSCANAIHSQITAFKEKQKFDLKVVSAGWLHGVAAVGVMGCTSCNKNPHITVATAPGTEPNESNNINKWQMLPIEKQISLHGMVWQRGNLRSDRPPLWSWSCRQRSFDDIDLNVLAKTAAVRFSKAFLNRQTNSRPKHEDTLRKTLVHKGVLPNRLWVIHPTSLALALGVAAKTRQELEERLQPPPSDPLGLFENPPALPSNVLERAKRDFNTLTAQGISMGLSWLTGHSNHPVSIDVDSVVQALLQDGALKIGEGGIVEYLDLGNESSSTAKCNAAYCCPWPLGMRKKTEKT